MLICSRCTPIAIHIHSQAQQATRHSQQSILSVPFRARTERHKSRAADDTRFPRPCSSNILPDLYEITKFSHTCLFAQSTHYALAAQNCKTTGRSAAIILAGHKTCCNLDMKQACLASRKPSKLHNLRPKFIHNLYTSRPS